VDSRDARIEYEGALIAVACVLQPPKALLPTPEC
jgi:hypothetical protein